MLYPHYCMLVDYMMDIRCDTILKCTSSINHGRSFTSRHVLYPDRISEIYLHPALGILLKGYMSYELELFGFYII